MAAGRKAARQKKGKLLVVDDDPNGRRVLLAMLRLQGYEVLEAANGEDGLALAARERPVLVILDVLMPGMDGFEVCRRMRENPLLEDTKVIMLTAQAGGAYVARGHALGADAYQIKPFDIERLLEQIRALLGETAPWPAA